MQRHDGIRGVMMPCENVTMCTVGICDSHRVYIIEFNLCQKVSNASVTLCRCHLQCLRTRLSTELLKIMPQSDTATKLVTFQSIIFPGSESFVYSENLSLCLFLRYLQYILLQCLKQFDEYAQISHHFSAPRCLFKNILRI